MFKEFLNKLQKYDIRIKKAVEGDRHGNFHSVFRGSGIEFSDVRPYHYGDEVRMIDWNITAKGHGPYLKMFQEEKEQTVFFLMDISGSQTVGSSPFTKLDATKEICGALVVSTIKEANQIGFLAFNDSVETYVRPGRGAKKAIRVLSEIYHCVPKSPRTNIARALDFARHVLARRSLVFIISDFIDEGYEIPLKALARKHDVVVLQIYEPGELRPPQLGIIEIINPETGKTSWINTALSPYKRRLRAAFDDRSARLETLCRQYNANYLAIDATQDYVSALIKLFKIRRFGAKGTQTH